MKNKLAILSNFNSAFILKFLENEFELFEEVGFNQWANLFTNFESNLSKFNPNYIFLLFDFNYIYNDSNRIFLNIDSYFQIINDFLQKNPNVQVFVSNIFLSKNIIYPNDHEDYNINLMNIWSKKLNSLANDYINFHIIDLFNLISTYGSSKAYSNKMMLLGSIPYTNDFSKLISDKINSLIRKMASLKHKVLCLDLDNTLWGGVLGDLGANGVHIGNTSEGIIFTEIQKLILQIKNQGVLLCIVSKNDINNVLEVFESNTNMILKKEDFTIIKANWKNKSDNIIEISQELNLGLDSIVFIDDNQFEINEVKASLEGIKVVHFANKNDYIQLINQVYQDYFFSFKLTNEDKNKTKQYETIKLRNQVKNSLTFEEYLKSLEMSISFGLMEEHEKTRVFQLINKTNQFNLNTQRFDLNVFNSLNTIDKPIFVASIKDKFGDEGLIYAMPTHFDNDNFYIDNIVMSCRVMGRNIEQSVFELLESYLLKNGFKYLFSKYIPSRKNKPVKDLLPKLGFELDKIDGNIFYYKKEIVNITPKAIVKAKWKN